MALGDKPLIEAPPPLTIPDFFHPPIPAAAPSSGAVNAGASKPEDQQLVFAGRGEPVPAYYGYHRIGLSLCWALGAGNVLYILHRAGWGEINAFRKFFLDGDEIWSGTTTHQQIIPVTSQIQLTIYHGVVGQPPDPQIVLHVPAYADTLERVVGGETRACSYVVGRYKAGGSEGFPELVAEFEGLLIKDPADLPAPARYSRNAGEVVYDLLRSPHWGRGRTVDETSVAPIVTHAAELLGGKARHSINLAIERKQSAHQAAETASREYADCYVRLASDQSYDLELASAHDTPSVRTIEGETDIIDGTWRAGGTGLRGTAKSVRIGWTDQEPDEWATEYVIAEIPDLTDPGAYANSDTVELSGIDNHEEANRRAITRLNYATLVNRRVSFEVGAWGVAMQRGDVVTLNFPMRGYANVLMRIQSTPEMLRPGRFRLSMTNWDASVDSDVVVAKPVFAIGQFEDPKNPPQVTGLVVVDRVPQDGGPEFLRLEIQFTGVADWPFLALGNSYEVIVRGPGFRFREWVNDLGPDDNDLPRTYRVDTPAINAEHSYRIDIITYSSVQGFTSDPLFIASYKPVGKLLRPPDVPSISAAIAAAGLIVQWPVVFDLGGVKYQVRVGAIGDAWEDMTIYVPTGQSGESGIDGTLTALNEINMTTPDEPTVPIQIGVKAFDNLFLESENPAFMTVAFDGSAALPGAAIQVWPRGNDFVEILNGFDHFPDVMKVKDGLQKDGWVRIASEKTWTMADRFGTGSPATNLDVLLHAKNDEFATSPDPNSRQDVDFISTAYREASSNFTVDEYDEDGAPVTSIILVQLGTISSVTSPQQFFSDGHTAHRNFNLLETNISFDPADVPNDGYGATIHYPWTVAAKRKPFQQRVVCSAARNIFPFTIDKDNEDPVESGVTFIGKLREVNAIESTATAVIAPAGNDTSHLIQNSLFLLEIGVDSTGSGAVVVQVTIEFMSE